MVYDAIMEKESLLDALIDLRNELCRTENFLDGTAGSVLDRDLASEINRAQARVLKQVNDRLYNLIQCYTPEEKS